MLKPMPALTETRDAVAIIHTPADQDQTCGDQHDVQEAAERIAHQRDAQRRLERRGRGTQAGEREEHAADPDDDAEQMDRLEQGISHDRPPDRHAHAAGARCRLSPVDPDAIAIGAVTIHVRTTAPRSVCDRAQSKVSSFRPLTRNNGWRKPARPATLTIATTHSFAGPAALPSSPRQRLPTTPPRPRPRPASSAQSAASRTSPASATARSAASTW